MRGIFSRHDQPFFNQADLIDIGPLSLAAVNEIITDGFEATGKDAGRVAALIHDLSGGHPQRTMRLADEVWRRTSGVPADEVWRDALEGVRRAEAPELAATYDDLEKGERKVLRLVANGESLVGAKASNLSLSYGGAAHARDRLLEDAKLLSDQEGRLMLTDPLLADWLRQRLPL